ncbi:FCS-Like Zinc finger 10-like [Benincasa hispida]|uniref:FCS-Like Zinc finger 10-like n=1 Tax=Benincasa hispida TaxID=102211 RepID=UPI0019021DDD|nr:FCS-Like Zinc finger 10-like [Benincasa hispida]XP_038896376.1 FCS-Like Zinc finger 10-like [Benincasa hispida]
MADSGSELCPVQSVVLEHKSKSSSFFSAPGLFVGLNFKVVSDSDSVKSPTSPLELRVFSNLSNSVGSPKSSHDGHRRSWDCSKVGLGIVDSLDDDNKLPGKALGSFESKNIIFGPQVRTKNQTPNLQIDTVFPLAGPRSLPKNCPNFFPLQFKSPGGGSSSEVFFEIGEPLESKPSKKSGPCSLDSPRFVSASYGVKGRSFFHSTNPFMKKVTTNGDSEPHDKILPADISTPASVTMPVSGIIESLSASEIELSEDYTRVISHGVNPKTTHIFGDCILECHSKGLNNLNKNEMNEIESPLSVRSSLDIPFSSQPIDFLSFCYFCNKKLESGKDIYIYRGEKAFCSSDCRYQEIMIEEELEKPVSEILEHSSTSGDGKEEFETHGTIFE